MLMLLLCLCLRNSRPQVKALLPEVCDVADRLLDKWTAIANHGQGGPRHRIHIVLVYTVKYTVVCTVPKQQLIVAAGVL
jgi:hypothetical protein